MTEPVNAISSRTLLHRLYCLSTDREAALICAHHADQIDLAATEFVNSAAEQSTPQFGRLAAIVLAEPGATRGTLLGRRVLQEGGKPGRHIGYRLAGIVEGWTVEIDPHPDTLPPHPDGSPMVVEEAMTWLYPPVSTEVACTVDTDGVLHFENAAEAVAFAEDTAAVLGEHGVDAFITVTMRYCREGDREGTSSYYRDIRHVQTAGYYTRGRRGGEA